MDGCRKGATERMYWVLGPFEFAFARMQYPLLMKHFNALAFADEVFARRIWISKRIIDDEVKSEVIWRKPDIHI